MTNSRTMRVLQAAASMLVLAAVWQIFSLFFPHYLFPPVPEIISRTIEILITGSLLADVLLTAARIFGGLFGAFILGCMLALVIGRSKTAENFIAPVLTFFQGIPALSWVVFAIIWFHGIEFRVLFIMVMTTLPAFTFQILDAFRSMSKDLFEMTMSFRPSRWTLFRFLIVPTIVPGILTAWKVNLGNAARVVVVAELVGATGGVGYELLRQQQLFDMLGQRLVEASRERAPIERDTRGGRSCKGRAEALREIADCRVEIALRRQCSSFIHSIRCR